MGTELKVKLTHSEGQYLLLMAVTFRAPEKLGTLIDTGMQAFIDDWLMKLREVLKSYSPKLTKDRRACFGDPNNWKSSTEHPDKWGMIDPDVELEVRFTEDALEGAYWAMIFGLHQSSPFKVGMNDVGDTIWPLAAKLGYTDALRSAIGLTDITKMRRAPRMQEISKG